MATLTGKIKGLDGSHVRSVCSKSQKVRNTYFYNILLRFRTHFGGELSYRQLGF